jgi:Domain of Unknown Function with PDB structure (DUF3857)
MIRRLFWLIICFLPVNLVSAEDTGYPVSSIKPELLTHADMVIRLYETRFDIKSYSRAILTVHRVITIFNEKEKNAATLIVSYDKSSKVNRIKGCCYDKSGKVIRKLSNSDITDRSMISDYSLYEDDRCKTVSFIPSGYPVTVEYEYEKEFIDRPSYPDWHPQRGANISVEQSHFTINCPTDLTFRYKENNIQQPAVITKIDKMNSYSWSISNIPALIDEPFSPDYDEIVPGVITAPSRISYKQYDDVFFTWEDFGKWQLYLNNDRDDLSLETQAKIKSLVQDAADKREKIRIIYSYLQSKTRYISIQVNIGGWQPFPASFVDKYSYGDCKALTNYTRSLLKAAGIESYYACVNAGKYAGEILTDFPSNQFNHVFLCVPCYNDTIWLECTSQKNPFGFLGTFTDNRRVLVVNPEGSRLVSTPRYTLNENRRTRTALVNFDSLLNAIAIIKTNYIGLKYEEINDLIDNPLDEQKRALSERLDLPDFVIRSISFASIKEIIPRVKENLTLFIPRYASLTGGRVFIPVNLLDKETYIPEKLDTRHTEIRFRRDEQDIDTIIYMIPARLKAERIPDSITIKSVFGIYSVKTHLDGNRLIYIRNYKTFKGSYPASSYSELIGFCKKIVKADRENVVFIEPL